MNKCTKTTSGKHYWLKITETIDDKITGVWLEGTRFLPAKRRCLVCGMIDDLSYPELLTPTKEEV